MRLSRIAAMLFGATPVAGFAGRLHADPISLDSGSTVTASADENGPTDTSTSPVNSLPFTTPTTATQGSATSTVDSNLTTSALNFTFNQSFGANNGFDETDGNGDILFTAGQGVSFSIAGTLTATGANVEGNLDVFLNDVTSHTVSYDFDQDFFNDGDPTSSSTLTLDATGGSLTGTLIAGHQYEFSFDEEMDNEADPTLTGNGGITFTQPTQPTGGASTPLPPAALAALLPLLMAGAMLLRGRRSGAAIG